jgi:hypothetical protein
MPLNPIPAVPAFSGPLPTQSDLVNYETNSSRYMTEAPVVIAGMNAAITGINQIAVAAQQAAALIGFRGLWSEQTGALARPASVLHENELWALASDVADVTAHEPSEASTVWALVRESAERVAYGESTVAAALDSLGVLVASLGDLAFIDKASLAFDAMPMVDGAPIVERGSNANGAFVRFADGTQLCRRTITSSASIGTTWTFPAVFNSVPVIGLTLGGVIGSVIYNTVTASSIEFAVRNAAEVLVVGQVQALAFGNWK